MTYTITKKLHWHMGHRIPNHKSKCFNIHGHTYWIEVEIESNELVKTKGSSDEGMLQDFSDIKEIIIEEIYNLLDHGFMIWDRDSLLMDLESHMEMTGNRFNIISVPFIPTAENIAKWCYDRIKNKINNKQRKLKMVTIWETPTSSARYSE